MVGSNHKSVIGTIVEHKFRYTLIVKLDNKKADHVSELFSKTLNKVDPIFKKTMTYDNGIEMAKHKEITQKNRNENILCSPLFFVGKRHQREHQWTYQKISAKRH